MKTLPTDDRTQKKFDTSFAAVEPDQAETLYQTYLEYSSQNDPKRREIGIECCRKAAISNHLKAQIAMGNCCRDGFGVKKNLAEMLKWYQKAADGGDPNGQTYLGLYYQTKAIASPENLETAVKQCPLATENGSLPA
ncbi:MAG: tetratricopeptide repeat protein [Anaerofustis sp.]